MEEKLFKVPIVLIFYKRVDTTEKVINSIRQVKPERVYLIADAPKQGYPEEKEKVKQTRLLVEKAIDWPCEIKRNYAEINMGCKKRVESGISWVFEQEEEAIIIEDDIVPSIDFYYFCQDMLERYRNNPEVLMVSGYKNVEYYQSKDQYLFSAFSCIWGWATWRRAWKLYDKDLSTWKENKRKGTLKWLMKFPSLLWVYWNIEYTYRKEIDAWGFGWNYARYINRGLGVVPSVNMIENIGFNSEDATHTKGVKPRDFSYGEFSFPIKEIPVIRDRKYDKEYIRLFYNGPKAVLMLIKKSLFYIIRKVFCFKKK